MKRLWNSSGFWTAIIASVVLVVSYKVTGSELIVTLIGVLFGVDKAGKAGEDLLKANQGISYNPESKRNERI